MANECSHLDQIKIKQTKTHVCEECVKTGDSWVHLRLCLSCGHVGCCDSSKNKHVTKHFHKTKHPLDSFDRARGDLDVVLRGRDRGGRTGGLKRLLHFLERLSAQGTGDYGRP